MKVNKKDDELKELNLEDLLGDVLIPKAVQDDASEQYSASAPSEGLRTPSTVLGITRFNASQKPMNRAQRLGMRRS